MRTPRRLLDAAVETGRPALTSLVLEGCPLLGAKALRGLAPSPLRPAQGAAAAADGGEDSSPQQAQQAGDANGAGAGGGTLLPAAPAFPRLTHLDLSCSGGGCGLLHLQLDAMQAAMPALQVLKLTALGGFHGAELAWASACCTPALTFAASTLHCTRAMHARMHTSLAVLVLRVLTTRHRHCCCRARLGGVGARGCSLAGFPSAAHTARRLWCAAAAIWPRAPWQQPCD